MGAQQSAMGGHGHKSVKLRRRGATAGAITADELHGAGVDISKAVAQMQLKDAESKSAASAASAATAAATPAAPAAKPSSLAASAAGRRSARGSSMSVEMPPWEVVANLSESDWLALRAWIEAGWRCKKCGHFRDDFSEHPKAMGLLKACKVVPPKRPSAAGNGNESPASNASSRPSTVTTGANMIEYASASPDHQVGYFSDSNSQCSSRSSSPRGSRPGGAFGHASGSSREASPRFHQNYSPMHEGMNPNHSGPMQPVGIEACPHLSKMGSGSFREQVPDSPSSHYHAAAAAAAGASGMPPRPMSGAFESPLQRKILAAITRAHQVYFIDKEPNGSLVFDYLLSALLDVTNSSFGFISSALLKADGTPYLKTHAMSNVAWTKELRAWYAANAHKGLVFTNMNTLHGSVVLTGHPVITNDAPNDPRARGIPPGHPVLQTFMGLPLFTGPELIGMFGLANSPEGYSEQLAKELEPLTMTVAQMIYAVNERKRRKEAELHLSSVVQVAKEGILSLSHSGHVTSMNFAARLMFGFNKAEEEEALGRQEIPPPAKLQFQQMILEIDNRQDFLVHGLEHHTGHVHCGVGKRIDGSTFPLEVSISKGTYDTIFYVAVIRDVTERMAAAKKLKESDQRWQYAISGSGGGVWEWDLVRNVLSISPKWKEMLGYLESELGSSVDDWERLLHPEDREAAFAALKEHLDGASPQYQHEHRLRCKDGAYKWFLHRGKVVSRSEDGEPEVMVTTHADISDKRGFESRMEGMMEAIGQAEQLNADLLAMAVHDIEPPAKGVVRHAEKLLGSDLPPEARESASAVKECGEMLLRAVGEKTDAAAVASGRVRLESSPFNVLQVLETAGATLEAHAEAAGAEIFFDVAQPIPPLILGDAPRTLQIFVSLLSVAIRGAAAAAAAADGSGSGASLIRVELRSDLVPPPPTMAMAGPQQMVLLVVHCQQQKGSSEDDKETLSSASQLASLMGGMLTVEEEGGPMCLSLPAKYAQPNDKLVQLWAAAPPEVSDETRTSRVLLVGPSQELITGMGRQLAGWRVPFASVVASPEEAFLSLLPNGNLPPVSSPSSGVLLPQGSYGNISEGLAAMYDVVVVDVSSGEVQLMYRAMQSVFDALGREKVAVLFLVSALQAKAPEAAAEGQLQGGSYGSVAADVRRSKIEVAVGASRMWVGRSPVLLKKPMVRPSVLLSGISAALAALKGTSESSGPTSSSLAPSMSMSGSFSSSSMGLGMNVHQYRLTGRVLLAEDNVVNRKVFSAIIAGTGAMVEIASNGMEAVALFQSRPYNLIIMDCQMPEMDGWAASRKIRDIESLRSQPRAAIVGLAANPMHGDREKCLAAGMSDFIAKPVSKETLELVLQRCLQQI